MQVTLVANAASLDADPALERFADALWKAHANQEVEYPLHSLWVNLNPSLNNNILSYEDEAWWLLHSQQDSMAGHAALPYLHELIPDPSDIDDEEENETRARVECRRSRCMDACASACVVRVNGAGGMQRHAHVGADEAGEIFELATGVVVE